MATALLYETEAERLQHLTAIHNLALDLGISEDFLKKCYEKELISLKERARVKDFLTVLVTRRIKDKRYLKEEV